MSHHYTKKPPESKAVTPFYSTHYTQCKPLRRCKNHQTCRTCRKIWIKQQIKKTTNHLTPVHLKKYSRQYYITINPTWFNTEIEESASSLDLFIKGLIAGKRAAGSLLNRSEYIFIKEISHSKALGHHAHYNLILLTNKQISNQEISGYRFHVTPISHDLDTTHSKAQYNHKNGLIQNIRNIIAYSLKADQTRINLERITKLSKGKHDLFTSSLFKSKETEKQKKFSIHISSDKQARKEAAEARKHALRLYACALILRPNMTSIQRHKEALKARRKIEAINKRLAAKLKAAKPRKIRLKTVHTTQKSNKAKKTIINL